jgi:hypothetical protein
MPRSRLDAVLLLISVPCAASDKARYVNKRADTVGQPFF